MKATKSIQYDVRGSFIEHKGVKYRPQIISTFDTEKPVSFNLPHERTDDNWPTVTQGGVTEKWEPQTF